MIEDDNRENPFVGLRPFFDEDSFYFFGRNEQVTELLELLHSTHFVPVLGSSGSGKSSLVRAGLIPNLRAGFMVADRDGWRMAKCLPGDAPIENLAEALLRAVNVERTPLLVNALATRIREDFDDAVIEVLRPHLSAHESVLILVDQFEELFAFRGAAGAESDDDPGIAPDATRTADRLRRRRDASLLVSLLLALAERKDTPVYVVTTMRTDFLGDCDIFTGLPEAINRSGYLVPRLSRAQLRSAIEGPARLVGARAAPRLVDRILNDVGDRMDRLPLMQHALRRTFEAWKSAGMMGPIDLADFNIIGGLDGALNVQAEATIADIDLQVAERVFKRLTAIDKNQRRVRHPARLSDLRAIAGKEHSTALNTLLDRCVSEGTNFMFASADGTPSDPRYNITHESLIRQWARLRTWVDEEQADRDWYIGVASRAALYAGDAETGLMPRRDLRIAQEMVKERAPTAEWASRYPEAATSFDDAMQYVRASERRAKTVRRNWIVGAVAILMLTAGATWKVLQSGELAKNALARVDEVARDAAIEKLGTAENEDPTYAAAIAAELADETSDPSTWSAQRRSLLQRVLTSEYALAEYRGVRAYDIDSTGKRIALAFDDGRTEIVSLMGSRPPLILTRAKKIEASTSTEKSAKLDRVINTLFVKDGGIVVAYQSGRVNFWRADAQASAGADVAPTRSWHVPEGLQQFEASAKSDWFVGLDSLGSVSAWKMRDSTTGESIADLVDKMYVNPDDISKAVITSVVDSAMLLDVTTGRTKNLLPGDNPVTFVAFKNGAADELLVGNARGPVLRIHAGGAIEKVGKDSAYTSGAFNPRYNKVVLSTSLGFVEVYSDDAREKQKKPQLRFLAHEESARAEFSGDGEWILSRSGDGSVRWTSAWDTLVTAHLSGHRTYVWAARTTTTDPGKLTRDSRVVTADVDGKLRVWRIPGTTLALQSWTPPQSPIWAQLANNSDRALLALTDLQTRAAILGVSTLADSAAEVQTIHRLTTSGWLAFSPSGRYAFYEDDAARPARMLWTLPNASPRALPRGDATTSNSAFSTDDSLLVLVENRGFVLFIGVGSGAPVRAPYKLEFGAGPVAIAPKGHVVAVADSAQAVLFSGGDYTTRRAIAHSHNGAGVTSMLFSANGEWLLTMDDYGLMELASVTATDSARAIGASGMTAGAISSNGALIAGAGDDGTIRIFRRTAKPGRTAAIEIRGVEGTTVDLMFGAGDTSLVATGGDGDIHVWPLLGDSAVGLPLTLQHTPRVLHQRTMPVAQTVMSADGKTLTSAVRPDSGYERVGRWELDPKALKERLLRTTSVCLDMELRKQLLPGESDAVRQNRMDACEKRAGRIR